MAFDRLTERVMLASVLVRYGALLSRFWIASIILLFLARRLGSTLYAEVVGQYAIEALE